jgi:tetratricopeptide (TPR) repeat protein
LAALEQAQAKRPESDVQVRALGVRIEAKLNPDAALVERARQLVHAAPGDPEALLALAEAALAVHDAPTANEALKQRFAVAPNDPSAHYLLGKAQRMLLDATGAEASFRKALELSPGQIDMLLALGELLLDVGKYADADAIYQDLSSRGASLLAGRLGRVEALLGLGRVDDAQVQLDGVPEAERASAGYRMLAARVALAHKKPGEALSLLRPLVDATVKKAAVMVLYGDALFAAEQIDASAGAYDAALALDAGLPEALIGRADVYLRAERPADALEVLDTAQKALPARLRPPQLRARMLGILGHAYIMRNRKGDLETARALLREANGIASAPAEVLFWLGESLGGKITPEARAAYHRYLELEPGGKYADRATRALGPLL